MHWADLVAPFAVELVALEVDRGHFLVGDFDAGGVGSVVCLGVDIEALSCGGSGDQTHDHFEAGQWLSAPVLADE